jgi:hypothetical protein
MIRIISYTILLLISYLAKAQVSENRVVEDFSKIKVATGINVFYTISDTKSIEVATDDNEKLQLIKTEFENDLLSIYVDTKDYKQKKNRKVIQKNSINGVEFKNITITISGPNLEAIKASSSATIKFTNTNKTESLSLEASSSGDIIGTFEANTTNIQVSSSGDIKGNLQTKDLAIKASSSGDLELTGKAENTTIDASSSADCLLRNLSTEQATVKASSSADVVITVMKSIEANASSSANIIFYGNPSEVIKEESTSGTIKAKN